MVSIINMRMLKNIFVIAVALTNLINAAPASFLRLEHRSTDDDLSPSLDNVDIQHNISVPESSTTETSEQVTYDQRQNGTENYRIQVKGFVVLIAPADSILLASGGQSGTGDILSGLAGLPIEKPTPNPDEMKPVTSLEENASENVTPAVPKKKLAHKPHLKLASFLAPFLQRVAMY